MQTALPQRLLATTAGKRADTILRSCVHCGFCTATCPTFLLTGNELDSPRGRIYLIKQYLEQDKASAITREHLDRCLSCQSCETTCPSNVHYHELLNIGRGIMADVMPRPLPARLVRIILLSILGSKGLFSFLVATGKLFSFLLPRSLARQLPPRRRREQGGVISHDFERKVILLGGCVQSSLAPDTNSAATKVFNRLGIGCIKITKENCCGAMHYHGDAQAAGRQRARSLIDQIEAALATGAESVISTASGCGSFIKDYDSIFVEDEVYRNKAEKIREYVKDIGEFLHSEDLDKLAFPGNEKLAFHSPCTLQHGQKLSGIVENILDRLGFTLASVKDSHLCCGSAGTYSLLQPVMARQLRNNKIQALTADGAEKIATANIGCHCHLAGGVEMQVGHWIEYVAAALKPAKD